MFTKMFKGLTTILKNIKSLVLSLALVSIFFAGTSAKAAGDIGVIDKAKILDQYTASQDAQKKILAERERIQSKFNDLNKSLEDALKDKALSEAQKLQKRKEAKDSLEADKKKFDSLVQTLGSEVENKILSAIAAEAKAQNLILVVSKTDVFYGGKDITAEVVKRLK
ncbi:MAG: OmpH family outer membrane protein [Candidatus Caenarcaniphilales bacterium]|nr:OmpH family outer membrane protein [Candidatus Caenarcaniphilales bacterium]